LDQPGDTVNVNGREVSRFSLEKALEWLDHDKIMGHHRKIAKDKSLLKWLHGKMNIHNTPWSWGPLKDPDYCVVVLPPLGTQLGKKWVSAIKVGNNEDIGQLEELFRGFPDLVEGFAGKEVGEWLKGRKDWMERIMAGTESLRVNFNRAAYDQYLTPHLGKAMISLPPSHAEVGVGYLVTWAKWSVHLHKQKIVREEWIQNCWNQSIPKLDFPNAKKEQAQRILKAQLPTNRKVNFDRIDERGKSTLPTWGAIFSFLLFVLVIIRLLLG
jgi:hypothetical protein